MILSRKKIVNQSYFYNMMSLIKNLTIFVFFNQILNFFFKKGVSAQFLTKNNSIQLNTFYSFNHTSILRHLENYWDQNFPAAPIRFQHKGVCQAINYLYLHDYFYTEDKGTFFLDFSKKLESPNASLYLDHLFQQKEKLVNSLSLSGAQQSRKNIEKKLEHFYRDIAYIDQLLWHYAPSFSLGSSSLFDRKHSRLQLFDNYKIYGNSETIFIFELKEKKDKIRLLDLIAPTDDSVAILKNGMYEFTTWDHSLLFKVNNGENILFDANGGFYHRIMNQYDHLSRYRHKNSGYLILHIINICKKTKKNNHDCSEQRPFLEKSFMHQIKLLNHTDDLTDHKKRVKGELLLIDLLITESYDLFDDYLDELLSLGINVDADPDGDQVTALSLACLKRHLPTINRLIKAGACVNQRDQFGFSLLMVMSILGFEDVMMLLIKNGANLNLRNKELQQALHLALVHHRKDSAFFLIKEGADVNSQDSNGMTPLHLAIENQYIDLITALIEAGANLSLRNTMGQTPFDLARDQLSQSIEIMKILELVPKNRKLRF